jgi:hypothetical protein
MRNFNLKAEANLWRIVSGEKKIIKNQLFCQFFLHFLKFLANGGGVIQINSHKS